MNTEQNKDLREEQPEGAPAQDQPEEEAPVAEEAAPAEGAIDEAPVEAVPAPQPEESSKAPKKKKINMNKWKRGGMATLLSVVFIAIVIALNIVVTALTQRYPSLDIDLTVDKRNSLSDQALGIAKGVEMDTEIYLVGTEDAYRKDLMYANYGLKYSQVANLAERLAEANSHIKVQFVDPDTNPELMSQYAAESLTNGMVLVRTEKRYKVLSVADMFELQQSQMTMSTETYTKVDSALAGALEMVNLEKVPVLTICTGHGELLSSQNMGQFIAMMEDQNFSVQEVDILTEEIPEETQVLMIPTPGTDYTEEEIQKVQAFLDDPDGEGPVAVLATCHPTQSELPRLTGFLEEWGIKVHRGVVAESDAGRMAAANAGYILVDPTSSVLGDNTYNRLLAPNSAPLSFAFDSNADITTKALWRTADSAYVVTEEGGDDSETGQWVVAAMASKVQVDGQNAQRNLIVFGSSYVFTDSFIEATAFGNRDYLCDLLAYATGTDGSAVTVVSESVQTNVLDVTMSRQTAGIIGLGVFTIGLPLAILAVGLVIFLKRRHL